MRFDKLTIKAQELIQQAQSLAAQHGNQQIEPEHLLSIMLSEREGIATSILLKLGVALPTIQHGIEQAIDWCIDEIKNCTLAQFYRSLIHHTED